MQHYRSQFDDPDHVGTVGSVQRCLRTGDLDEIGDRTHHLTFHMLGLFSFRHWCVPRTLGFWMEYLDRIGVVPTHVTVHPDREDWRTFWDPWDLPVHLDPDCTWTDGHSVGYCTELYVDDVEIGNVVNPHGGIDVGFGLERLELVLGEPPPTLEHVLTTAAVVLLDEGIRPSNKRQGYVLRRILRRMVQLDVQLDHPVFRDEVQRQKRLRDRYERLRRRFPDQSPEWWWETHGIEL